MRYLAITAMLAAALGFGTPAAMAGEIYFDPSSYTSLAAAGSQDTIAPGTQITLRNWQSYKRFLPFGLQAVYSGRYQWHIGSGPEYTLTVGTTSHVSLTRQFVLDTEKYSSQAPSVPTSCFPVPRSTPIGYCRSLCQPTPTSSTMRTLLWTSVCSLPAFRWAPITAPKFSTWNDRRHPASLLPPSNSYPIR